MNLRFNSSVLSLILSISSTGARRTDETSSILPANKLIDSSSHKEGSNQKLFTRSSARGRRQLAQQHQLISIISVSEQGLTNNNVLDAYHPDVGILHGAISPNHYFRTVLLMNGRVQRNAAAAAADAAAAVGKVDNLPRALQTKETPMPLCGTNGTCLPSACDCRANLGVISDQCAPIFKSLCDGYIDANGKNWTLEGCFDPSYPGVQKYARNAYCEMSECIVNGGSSGSCYCQLYHSMCNMYGNERLYNAYALLGLCEVDACCQNKTDDDGRISCLIGYPNGAHSQDQYRKDHPRCGTNGTCNPSVCSCVANYGPGGFSCAAPINDICSGVTDANGKRWEFEGCYRDYPDYPNLQLYSRTVYCALAKCVVDGGEYGSCYCQGYHSLCERFGDVRMYHPIPNKAGFCTIDVCCQSKSDEAGKSSCFKLTNSTPTTAPTVASKNTPVQEPSTIAGGSPYADNETPAVNEPPNSSATNKMPPNSAGALSSLVAAVAAMSILGCSAS